MTAGNSGETLNQIRCVFHTGTHTKRTDLQDPTERILCKWKIVWLYGSSTGSFYKERKKTERQAFRHKIWEGTIQGRDPPHTHTHNDVRLPENLTLKPCTRKGAYARAPSSQLQRQHSKSKNKKQHLSALWHRFSQESWIGSSVWDTAAVLFFNIYNITWHRFTDKSTNGRLSAQSWVRKNPQGPQASLFGHLI